MNLVLLHAYELDVDGRATLDGDRACHVREVLLVRAGDRIRVGVLDGPIGAAEIVALLDDGTVRIACTLDASIPEPPRIDLVLALPRPKVLARLLSPIAQLGVARLMLTGAWKVERFYFDAHILDPREHVPKLIEGLAQAKDTRVPIVTVHRSLAFLLDQELDARVANAARVVVDPSAPTPLEEVIAPNAAQRLVLAIGPEGGYTQRELDQFAAARFTQASLGVRTLRSDVASIAALARAHAALR